MTYSNQQCGACLPVTPSAYPAYMAGFTYERENPAYLNPEYTSDGSRVYPGVWEAEAVNRPQSGAVDAMDMTDFIPAKGVLKNAAKGAGIIISRQFAKTVIKKTGTVITKEVIKDAAVVIVKKETKQAAKQEGKQIVKQEAKSLGRQGKQAKLRSIATDDKQARFTRGWVNQEKNAIKAGKRKNIRNPPGYDLAHKRGYEAKKGFGYDKSQLQTKQLHRLQHKYDAKGTKNKLGAIKL